MGRMSPSRTHHPPSPARTLSAGFRTVKLACKSERVEVDWDGTCADLTRIFTEEFTSNETPKSLALLDKKAMRVHVQKAFRLWDKERHVAYEGFDFDDVKDGDTIQVNFELYSRLIDLLEERRLQLRKTRLARQEFAASRRGGQSTGSAASRGSLSPRRRSFLSRFDPRNINIRTLYGRRRTPSLVNRQDATWKVKLWALMDDPTSSSGAAAVAIFVLVLITYSTATFCVQTLHGQYVEDLQTDSFWYISEAVCIAIFTVEAVLRLASCPSKWEYLQMPMNLVDIVAIMPFYLELIIKAAMTSEDAEVPGLAVVRVVRLVRVFRLLKVSKGSIALFTETLQNSVKPLNMLFMLVLIGLVVCASLMYFIERGRFNVAMGYWERPQMYMCEVFITAPPGGPSLGAAPTYAAGAGNACTLLNVSADMQEAAFECSYPYMKNPNCRVVYEQSPFSSILGTMWWAWVTMTSVGYGDLSPTTLGGKIFGMIVMLFGILVLALPITVIGSNFATAYNREQQEEEMALKAELASERRKQAEAAAASFNSGKVSSDSGEELDNFDAVLRPFYSDGTDNEIDGGNDHLGRSPN